MPQIFEAVYSSNGTFQRPPLSWPWGKIWQLCPGCSPCSGWLFWVLLSAPRPQAVTFIFWSEVHAIQFIDLLYLYYPEVVSQIMSTATWEGFFFIFITFTSQLIRSHLSGSDRSCHLVDPNEMAHRIATDMWNGLKKQVFSWLNSYIFSSISWCEQYKKRN